MALRKGLGLFVAAALTVVLRQPSAHALVRAGGTAAVSVNNQFFMAFVTQNATDWVTIQTANLSAGGDTVIHVADASDANGAFVAGDDDFNNQLSSYVFIPATGTARTLRVIVRSFASSSAGTCDVYIDTPTSGYQFFYTQPFGGTPMSTQTTLETSTHVQTVELQNTVGPTTDTVMLVVSGSDASHAVAMNDDGAVGAPGGLALMSFVQLPEQCPAGGTGCLVIVADFRQEAAISTEVVYDSDIGQGTDSDGDGLGDVLETTIGTSPTAWDTDLDGIGDGEEVMGIDIQKGVYPPVKFPYMGANPLQKDLFVEVDWQNCNITNLCPGGSEMAQMQPSDVANLKAAYAPLHVHFDTGVTNSNPATWFDFGNWGGATRVDPANQLNPAFCEGLSPERQSMFHYYLASQIAPGHSPVGPDNLHNGDIVSACSMGVANYRTSGHEMGHQFGLGHGGRPSGIDINNKAHYVSMMNYGYEFTAPGGAFAAPGFSQGSLGQLNPTALDETVGIRSVNPGLLSALGSSQWQYTVNTAANTPLPGPAGAVDWNKDGVISPAGTTVRASISQNANAIRWDAASLAGSTYMSSSNLLNDPALGWVSAGGSRGDWLFMFGRRVSNGTLVFTHITKSQLDSGCGSLFTTLSSDSTPNASWDCAGVPQTLTTGPTSAGNPVFAPAIAETGTGKMILLEVTSGGFLWSSVMTIDQVTGAVSFGTLTNISNTIHVTGDVTMVATAPGVVEALAPVGNRLKQWIFTNGQWQLPTDQMSGGSPIVPASGIGATFGYQDGSSIGHVYAAIPLQSTPTNGKLMFARQESNGTWTNLSSSAFSSLGAPFASARPGLAYQRTGGAPVTTGRFYLVWETTGGGQPAQMTTTQGNLSTGSTKLIKFNAPAWNISPLGQFGMQTGIPLVDDVNRDSNLRAILNSANPNGTGMTTAFAPLADGIVNANYKDQGDFTYILGNLQACLGQTSQLP